MAGQAVVPSERDSSDEGPASLVKGRQRKSWEVICKQALDPSESLRRAGQKWLQQQGILHKTLMASSAKGVNTLIARCSSCLSCSKQWCFSNREGQLQVETVGFCSGDKDLERLKRSHARAFAKDHTPGRALKKMSEAKIPKDERPEVFQLKNRRPKKEQTGPTEHSVSRLGDLREFVSDPPAGVTVFHDSMVLEKERVVLAFGLKEGINEILQEKSFPAFVWILHSKQIKLAYFWEQVVLLVWSLKGQGRLYGSYQRSSF